MRKITETKRATAAVLAFCLAVGTLAGHAVYGYKTSVPSWITNSGEDSWSKDVEEYAVAKGLKPTGLGLMGATWNHSGQGEFPYTLVTTMDAVENGDKAAAGYEEFTGRGIYCASYHKIGADLRMGTQFFFDKAWNEDNIPDFVSGTGDQQKFNFLMMVSAIELAEKTSPKPRTDNGDFNGAAQFLSSFPIIYGVTDQKPGYDMNDLNAALELYKTDNIVLTRAISDAQKYNPTVYEQMMGGYVGSPFTIDVTHYYEWFFCSVWASAKMAMDFHSASPEYNYIPVEEGGRYVVNVSFSYQAFKEPVFYDISTTGDWIQEEYVVDDANKTITYKLSSDTGNVPEDGIIATAKCGEDNYEELAVVGNKSKLYTFKCFSRNDPEEKFNLAEKNGGFDITQTFFSVYGADEIEIRAGNGTTGDDTLKRYKHEEGWTADYNVDLAKFDSETGKALEGAEFDILEKDLLDEQLPATNLDDDGPQGNLDGTGTFHMTEWEEGDSHDTLEENYTGFDDNALVGSAVTLYNWGNDRGTQFDRWDDPYDDYCGNDINITGADGHIYYGDNYGNNSGDKAHKDVYRYGYKKGYCEGHPVPQPEYIPVPEEEEDEEGNVTNQDAIDAAIEENKRIHREAWDKWYNEVQICEQLANEGGFFHCILPGDTAKQALETDRDQFYIDFISLTYDYSAKEQEAREGYILHGLHTDDIPLEWRTVTSSQYKDYMENGLNHSGGKAVKQQAFVSGVENLYSSGAGEIIQGSSDDTEDLSGLYQNRESRLASFKKAKTATMSEAETKEDGAQKDEAIADITIHADSTEAVLEETTSRASASEASYAKKQDLSGTKSERSHTGFLSALASDVKSLFHTATNSSAVMFMRAEEEEGDGTGGGKGGLRNSVVLDSSTANNVVIGDGTILDWTFILYDHRTEGEIHINKQDFDLLAEEAGYGSYGDSNGDGTLEGAVYGLFASNDISHPDGKTGTVYKKDNLLAIATTDRDGNASFLALTEAPGHFYDYKEGRITKTADGFADAAPDNLHVNQETAADKESDMEEFEGHNPDNSEITAGNGNDLIDSRDAYGAMTDEYYEKNSSNQGYDDTYREDQTTGYYPISNNEKNNGNCWIGRPLFVNGEGTKANYYIKELSRSEGYELSIAGKEHEITNGRLTGDELNNSEFVTTEGSVSVTKKLAMDVIGRFNTFQATSAGTTNGYDITLYNIPEHAEFSTYTRTVQWTDEGSHTEKEYVEVPVIGTKGSAVIIGGNMVYAEAGDSIILPNGSTITVNEVSTPQNRTILAIPQNTFRSTIPAFTGSASTQMDDFIADADWALGLSRAKAPENAPWVRIELIGDTADEWAESLHDGMVAAGLESFNRTTIAGHIEEDGKHYALVRYSYIQGSRVYESVYDEETDILYVKQDVNFEVGGETKAGYIYIPYKKADMISYEEADNGFITRAVVTRKAITPPDFVYPQEINYVMEDDMTKSYWVYDGIEQARNNDGSLKTKMEERLVEKPGHYETVYEETEVPAEYKNGIYYIHMDQEDGALDFKITYNTSDGQADLNIEMARDKGIITVNPTYKTGESYIQFAELPYIDDKNIISDAGSIETPVNVLERPIRQKIKVNKDIQTLQETKQVWYCLNCGYENGTGLAACAHCSTARTTEETKTVQYAHDTYSAVHGENISADRNAGAYETSKDWLAKLLGNEVDGEEAKTIPNFRFKAYLKSNLERLYRNQDGNIVWLDRNGNVMTPLYQDTNGDGNYNTFTWKYDTAYEGKETDFPEKDKITEAGILESSNVQKIYTKIEHNEDSRTTSALANNVWDDYDTPQGGATDNVGEKEGFSTSQREKPDGSAGELSGKAVDGNAALYSYRGKNTNTAQTDRINEEQNAGYSRLLETRQSLMEDGAGASRQVELYNYEKFFDAIAAANADIWDNDMHSTFTGASMANYPGQHWFETHYEKYQKDDADPDHTLDNTDRADRDNTAGGDWDTSFKPFRWIREHVFGGRSDYEKHPAQHNGTNTEVVTSTSDFARANAEASDAVRQFAVKWYLEDEAAKLMVNNGVDEDIAKSGGIIGYDEAVYDEALFHAFAKAYNYLKPFYVNDLDTIYSVEWDSAENGGADKDFTTLSVDVKDGEEHYSISSYLPYGVYVVVEQQPERRDGAVNDFENRSYTIEKPKEVIVPSVYDAPEANDTADNYDGHYSYRYGMTAQDQAKAENYLIRFAEEWAHNNPQDEREYVIRAHGYHGDYEVYKYGLDIDRLTGAINYGTNYDYAGWRLAQDVFDPIKDYYDTQHKGEMGLESIGTENGGNDASDYMAIHKTDGLDTANGGAYDGKPLQDRFFYGSISEDAGVADNVMFKGGAADAENASGMRWEDNIRSMTGELTAYEGKYASMLVPWTVTAPADLKQYSSADFTGYADVNERDGFYATMLRINKVDSETGEYILHDNAIFALYAGSRYNTFEEIEEDAKLIGDAAERAMFLAQFKPGDAKFYLKDTTVQGTREFLTAMGATDITPAARGKAIVDSAAGPGELCSGLVKKGTPICVESERIMLTDEEGARTGQMTVYTTINDVLVAGEEDAADKAHANQNTGYFITPQPIGAGVYVLAEIKAPDGYARSKPVPFEVYSDKTQYYVDGDMYNKVSAVRYEDKLAD